MAHPTSQNILGCHMVGESTTSAAPTNQAKNLLHVVRPRRTRETHQESLGNRRFRKGHARERDEGEAKHDNDDSRHDAHAFTGVLKSRRTGGASAASEKPKATSESAARACQAV